MCGQFGVLVYNFINTDPTYLMKRYDLATEVDNRLLFSNVCIDKARTLFSSIKFAFSLPPSRVNLLSRIIQPH